MVLEREELETRQWIAQSQGVRTSTQRVGEVSTSTSVAGVQSLKSYGNDNIVRTYGTRRLTVAGFTNDTTYYGMISST